MELHVHWINRIIWPIARRSLRLLPVGLLLAGLSQARLSIPAVLPASAQDAPPLNVGAEVVERRTAFSRHTYLGQDHYQAEIASRPLNYRDSQGNWRPVDTTLLLLPDGSYTCQSNGLRLFLPADNRAWVRLESDYPSLEARDASVGGILVPSPYQLLGGRGLTSSPTRMVGSKIWECQPT
jgi:hypothetical protein